MKQKKNKALYILQRSETSEKQSDKVQNNVSVVSTHAYKFEDPRNQPQMLLPGKRTRWETDGEDDLFTTDLIFFLF